MNDFDRAAGKTKAAALLPLKIVQKSYVKPNRKPLFLRYKAAGLPPVHYVHEYLRNCAGQRYGLISASNEMNFQAYVQKPEMVSKKTVDNHIANIYSKFRVHNSVGVLKLAVSNGILPVEDIMTDTE